MIKINMATIAENLQTITDNTGDITTWASTINGISSGVERDVHRNIIDELETVFKYYRKC